MKTLICTLFIFLSLSVSAHTPTQKCSNNGRVIFTWSDIGSATSIEISYGHYDTTISLKHSNVTNFAAPVGTKTSVKFKFNDGYETSFVVVYNPCALPITLEYFKGHTTNSGVSFEWKTDLEVNVKYYQIQYSAGGAWSTVAIVIPKGAGNYNYVLNSLIEAGMLTGLVVLFLVGLVYKYRKAFAVVIAVGLLVSCSKQNVNPPTSKSLQGFYRLAEVDQDNNIQYSPVIEIK